jgi:hypothetical protein
LKRDQKLAALVHHSFKFIDRANNRAAKSYSSLDGYLNAAFSNKYDRPQLRAFVRLSRYERLLDPK